MKDYKFIRYIEFGDLFEIFFLSAILTILGIRIYLKLTGFPQIGSGPFHIAHLLFGGFFMLISILASITYLNNNLKSYWALLGGIGFGTFIDEIGKFITRDNNYFFQPTFAIIYVIFILLYLLYKSVEHYQKFSADEYLVNSITILQNLVLKNFDKEEKREALDYLSLSDQTNPLTKQLFQIFSKNPTLPDEELNVYEKINKKLKSLYHFFLDKPWFLYAITIFFIVRSVIYLRNGIFLLQAINKNFLNGTLTAYLTPHGILPMIQVFALGLQAIFTIIGAILIWRFRKKAYIFFRDSVFVSVFILQIFNFNNNPEQALFSTAGDLLLLGILNYIIKDEK